MSTVRRTGRADMDIGKVRELVKLVEESGIEELEVSHKDTTIRINKHRQAAVAGANVISATVPVGVPVSASAVPVQGEKTAEAAPDPSRSKWKDVRSPIVGTFYRAASPTSDLFVNVGDHVVLGQTLCIVEAMKVMNEIEAEFGGVVKEILAENAEPVEAEGVLFLIDPD